MKAMTSMSSTIARLFSSTIRSSSRAFSAFSDASARAAAAASALGPAGAIAVCSTSSHAKMTSVTADSYVFSNPPATSALDLLDLCVWTSVTFTGFLPFFLKGFLAIPPAARIGSGCSSSSRPASKEKSRKPSGNSVSAAAASRSGSRDRSKDSTPSHSCRHVAARCSESFRARLRSSSERANVSMRSRSAHGRKYSTKDRSTAPARCAQLLTAMSADASSAAAVATWSKCWVLQRLDAVGSVSKPHAPSEPCSSRDSRSHSQRDIAPLEVACLRSRSASSASAAERRTAYTALAAASSIVRTSLPFVAPSSLGSLFWPPVGATPEKVFSRVCSTTLTLMISAASSASLITVAATSSSLPPTSCSSSTMFSSRRSPDTFAAHAASIRVTSLDTAFTA
mmetsp:Transcript_3391/g.15429  ORF Transcript_3391/g.15429 Transcript_3391/m.15429 type:complete len:397 (+) Transcript_3391:792-1982(+)